MPVEGARKGFCHSVGAGVQAGHQLQCSAQGWDGGPSGPGGASGRSPAAETHSQTQGLLLKSQRPGRQVRGRSGIALLLGFCSSFNPTGCDDKEGDGLLMGAPCMQHGRRAPLLAQLLRIGRGAPSAPSRASGALEPLAVLGGPHPQLPGHCPVCRASDQFRPFPAPHLVWGGRWLWSLCSPLSVLSRLFLPVVSGVREDPVATNCPGQGELPVKLLCSSLGSFALALPSRALPGQRRRSSAPTHS